MLQDHLPIDSFGAKAGAPYVLQHSVPVFLDVEGPTGNVCIAHNDLFSPVATETCSAEVTALPELPAAAEEVLVADAADELAEDSAIVAAEAVETAFSDCSIAPAVVQHPSYPFSPACNETCQQVKRMQKCCQAFISCHLLQQQFKCVKQMSEPSSWKSCKEMTSWLNLTSVLQKYLSTLQLTQHLAAMQQSANNSAHTWILCRALVSGAMTIP